MRTRIVLPSLLLAATLAGAGLPEPPASGGMRGAALAVPVQPGSGAEAPPASGEKATGAPVATPAGDGARRSPAAERAADRERMVRELLPYDQPRVTDPEVIAAMRSVLRHRFVPEEMKPLAYEDRPLPIGEGQTISQPYIVALMTDLLDLREGMRVLEIGTGSGYQAAILAELGVEVFTVEILAPLAVRSAATLKAEGFTRVRAKEADGYYGWPEKAPFDRIIVTAAATHVPPPLLRQLRPGGRMVIPVGSSWAGQELLLVEKDEEGRVRTRSVLPVRFVPLTGGGGR